jgi:hypothetical protein
VRQDGETVLEGEAWCYTFRPANITESEKKNETTSR